MKRKILLTRRGARMDCPLVPIHVLTRIGTVVPILFCIDTGADVSAIPLLLARREVINYPSDEASRGTAVGLVGSVGRHRGSVRVRIAGDWYTWPCDFIDAPGPSSVDPYGIIGRAGFLDDFAFCVNKPDFTLRRRKFWTIFLPPWTPGHEADEPL
jgi:hypothetical protein